MLCFWIPQTQKVESLWIQQMGWPWGLGKERKWAREKIWEQEKSREGRRNRKSSSHFIQWDQGQAWCSASKFMTGFWGRSSLAVQVLQGQCTCTRSNPLFMMKRCPLQEEELILGYAFHLMPGCTKAKKWAWWSKNQDKDALFQSLCLCVCVNIFEGCENPSLLYRYFWGGNYHQS